MAGAAATVCAAYVPKQNLQRYSFSDKHHSNCSYEGPHHKPFSTKPPQLSVHPTGLRCLTGGPLGPRCSEKPKTPRGPRGFEGLRRETDIFGEGAVLRKLRCCLVRCMYASVLQRSGRSILSLGCGDTPRPRGTDTPRNAAAGGCRQLPIPNRERQTQRDRDMDRQTGTETDKDRETETDRHKHPIQRRRQPHSVPIA